MKAFKFRRKFKAIFFLLRLDRIIPSHFFYFLANIASLSKWISVHKKGNNNDFYSSTFNYEKRESLYKYVIENQILDNDIIYLEFGVSKGLSFRWWLANIKNTEARFYGFDTFTGLPEDWGPFKKGEMSNGNTPPQIDDNRHEFFQGLFQETFPSFLSKYDINKRLVIHLDADLYSSTLYILTQISPYLKPGDILFFDEFNVPMHEFKAFKEWSDSFYIKYTVLGAVNNFYQVAIIIN